jgi:hypothetical protein
VNDDTSQIRNTLTDQWHKLIEVSEGVARIEVKCDAHSVALRDIQASEAGQNDRLLTVELRAKGHTKAVALLSSFIATIIASAVAVVLRHLGW